MSNYTPTTEMVLNTYANERVDEEDREGNGDEYDIFTALDEFDRWLAEVERAAAEKAILKLSGTKQAEAFENAVDIRPGKRKPLFVSVVRWLREEADEYRREEDE